MADNDSSAPPSSSTPALDPEEERRIKQLQIVVCICKGIKLGRVLKGLEGSETVEQVNQKTGCGSGGCKGERCGPRIRVLLRKYQEHKQSK